MDKLNLDINLFYIIKFNVINIIIKFKLNESYFFNITIQKQKKTKEFF